MRKASLLVVGISSLALLWSAAPALAQGGEPDSQVDAPPSVPGRPMGDMAIVSTLEDALINVYRNDPSFLGAQASQQASEYRYGQARAQFGPSVDLQARYGYYDVKQRDTLQISPTRVVRTPNFNRRDGSSGRLVATLDQPIFTSGRLSAQLQAANANTTFARENVRFVENGALQGAITSYVSVRRDRALYAIAEDNLKLLDRQFSESEQRFKVREITRADLDQVVTRVELGKATVAQARGALEISLGDFLNTVGAFAGDQLAPLPSLPNIPESIDQAYVLAEAKSPTLLAARARERQSRAQVKGAYADLGPSVSLQGTAITGGSGISPFQIDVANEELRGEVVLTMPIDISGRRVARISEAEATNESDWRAVDATVRDIHATINANWSQLMSTRIALGHLEASVAAAQRAYDAATVQLRAGATTTLDVLDLARDLLNARSSYVSAQADEYIARVNLLTAMGQLEIGNLYPGVQTYDALRHHRKASGTGIPILSDAVVGLDSLVVGPGMKDRDSRDPNAERRNQPNLPSIPPPTNAP